MANKRLTVLNRQSDFLKLKQSGRRIRCGNWLLVSARKNGLGIFRCGWILPRQVGSAVIRNRLKRWARVYFSGQLKSLTGAECLNNQDICLSFRPMQEGFYKRLSYAEFTENIANAQGKLLRS